MYEGVPAGYPALYLSWSCWGKQTLACAAGPVRFRQQGALQENWPAEGAATRICGLLADPVSNDSPSQQQRLVLVSCCVPGLQDSQPCTPSGMRTPGCQRPSPEAWAQVRSSLIGAAPFQ